MIFSIASAQRLGYLMLLQLVFASTVVSAAEPAEGTLSPETTELEFTSGPALISDPTLGTATDCTNSPGCDSFALKVELPADYAAQFPAAQIIVTLTSEGAAADFDLYLYDAQGEEVASSANGGSLESLAIPAGQGEQQYTVYVAAYAASGSSAQGKVTLSPGAPDDGIDDSDQPSRGDPIPTGLAPRFYYNQSPPGVGDGAGEPTVGFNPKTGRLVFIAGLEPVQIVPPERLTDTVDVLGKPLPASCEPQWESKPYELNVNTLDPIVQTEQSTGRTFQSQLSGANSIFSYTDDDGENWMPGQIGPPNGGADHQSVGSGPYSPSFVGVPNPDGYAVYYCSQSIAAAFCARSDDGGLTFGPGVPMFVPGVDCDGLPIGALHGHVQVSPDDGTVYVPFGGCGNQQAVAVSDDSGLTWTVRQVPETSPGDDPGVGVGADGTVYFCYVNDADGTPRAAVSKDKGETWSNYRNLADGLQIATAVFPTATAGDGDRAACAWLGTDDPSPRATESESDFPGIWYPYVSVTYDGGNSWHSVNVSPNDPVQGAGGICLAGTTCGPNRNLLDFNDVITDDQGRVVFAHADGCVGPCVNDPAKNSFTDNGVIARQSGGRTLRAAFDDVGGSRFNAAVPLAPEPACLDVTQSVRDASSARLLWASPDDGGAAVGSYEIQRTTTIDGEFIKVGESNKNNFTDTSVDASVEKYYYRIVARNSVGASPESNTIELPVTAIEAVDTCTLPGSFVARDALGDGASDDTDIEYIAAAELPDMPDHLALTYKVSNFTAGVPPATAFYALLFQDLLGDGVNRYVAVDATAPVAPRQVFGTYAAEAAGALVFTESGELEGDIGSDGTMVILVPREFFGNPEVGEVITGFDARARIGSSSATSRDTAGPGFYEVRGAKDCAAAGTILAKLDAQPLNGDAPLTVKFTVGGAPSTEAELTEWNLDFGDGESTSGKFSTTSTATHTYQNAGTYRANLGVTDSAGNASTNTAEKTIEVGAPGDGSGTTGGEAPRDAGRFGSGSLSGSVLMILAGLALLRRRQSLSR